MSSINSTTPTSDDSSDKPQPKMLEIDSLRSMLVRLDTPGISATIRCEVGGKGFELGHKAIIGAFLSMLVVGLEQMNRKRIEVSG